MWNCVASGPAHDHGLFREVPEAVEDLCFFWALGSLNRACRVPQETTLTLSNLMVQKMPIRLGQVLQSRCTALWSRVAGLPLDA